MSQINDTSIFALIFKTLIIIEIMIPKEIFSPFEI